MLNEMSSTVVLSLMRKSLLFFSMLFFFQIEVYASDTNKDISVVSKDKIVSLGSHPQWLALLHYEKQGLLGRVYSEVDDAKFFYSKNGKTDSVSELVETILEFQKNNSGDDSVYCRFPARLFFLQQNLPELQLKNKPCKTFDDWYGNVKGESVYLIFPASYMNSPSSMFGHTLLRLDGKQGHTLLSSAINFAAFTDPSDDEITFTVKGLSGGYPGYVSLVPYYEKVNEYNHIESRDIWEYKLKLSNEDIQLFTRHIWELNEIRFDYYFVDENCSYRLLTLLNVINPSWKLSEDFNYRTVPTDTIRVLEKHQLIGDVTYRPSKTSKINDQRKQLGLPQRKIARSVADDPSGFTNSSSFKALSAQKKAQVLELAYDYNRYLNLKEKVTDPDLQKRSLKLLSLRSKVDYDGTAFEPTAVPTVRDEEGHGTYRSTVSSGMHGDASYVELGMRINYHDWLDSSPGYRNGAQIEMGNVRFRATEDDIQLQHFDVISIRSLGPRNLFSQPISWQVNGGYERWASDGKGHNQLRLTGGLAYQFGPGVAYGMIATQLAYGDRYDHDFRFGVGPEVGYLVQKEKFNLWGSYEVLQTIDDSSVSESLKLSATYTLGTNRQLRLELQHQAWKSVSEHDLRLSYVIYH